MVNVSFRCDPKLSFDASILNFGQNQPQSALVGNIDITVNCHSASGAHNALFSYLLQYNVIRFSPCGAISVQMCAESCA